METATAEKKQSTKEDFYNMIFTAEGREQKKEILKGFSKSAKLMIEINPDIGDGVNDVIINKMYKNKQHQEFSTFKGWKEKGFKVKKGSKAFFIWSKPRKVEKKDDNGEIEKEFSMFGLAYLFSNSQVEPL